MKQLKDMESAFEDAGITNIAVVDETSESLKLQMTFADGSTLTTGAINIKGAKGDTGDPATVAVGTVTTGAAGSEATVTNVGTSSNAVFDFSIPRGDKGAAGGITDINEYTGAVTTGNGLTFTNGKLESYDFNLVTVGTVNMETLPNPTGIASKVGTLRYAMNADKTIGKIYGYFGITCSTISASTSVDIDTGIIVKQPSTSFSIMPGTLGISTVGEGGQFGIFMIVDTNGHVHIQFTLTTSNSGKSFWLQFPACLYFFADFGDAPEANTLAMRMQALNVDPIEIDER